MNKKRRVFTLITPTVVANNFIKKAQSEDIDVTPLKLQKLVYFLYKSYLKKTGRPLFSERFETWTYGPVVPSIYSEFSSYGNSPIKTYAQDSQGNTYMVEEKGTFSECIDEIWRNYKGMTGEALSALTHLPNTAWSIANNNKQQFLDEKDIFNES